MRLERIHLHHFRSFTDAIFTFHPQRTLVVGSNARGKTNLLEAIYVSIFGTGFRERVEEELIRWGETQCRLDSIWSADATAMQFGVQIKAAPNGVSKTYSVSGAKKTAQQYLSFHTPAVLFAPEHLDIVCGPPGNRRSYFDSILNTTDPQYRKRLRNYQHALTKRNKLLERHRSPDELKEELRFWNEYLEEQALYISEKRSAYVSFLNANPSIDHREFAIVYEQNLFNRSRAAHFFEKELRYRSTLIGPQKDEFIVHSADHSEKPVRQFGSRSEQRLSVFWLKLNEIRFYEQIFSHTPLLLLDDIFSELDRENKELIVNLIHSYQSVLTATEDSVPQLGKDQGVVHL